MLSSVFALLLTSLVQIQAKPTPTILQHDDVLLFARDGTTQVMKDFEYQLLEAKDELARRRAQKQPPPTAPLNKRCDESTEYQVLVDTTFNDWDVAMSPVISSIGSIGASVAVTKGYSVANSIYANNALAASLVQATLGIDIDAGTTKWTTSDDQSFTFAVPSGQYGLVVSNPYAHRVAGNILSGCTDSPTSETFSTTTYTAQSFTNMEWVKGPIYMCNSSTYPVPYCVGDGSHQ